MHLKSRRTAALPLLLLAAACLEVPTHQARPPLPDDPGPEPPAGAPHAGAIGTTYHRTLLYTNQSSDSAMYVLWDFANRVESDSIHRSVRGWMAREGEWRLFLEDEWATVPVRAPWRMLVRAPARLLVGDDEVWQELRYAYSLRDLSLQFGGAVSHWPGQRGEAYTLRRGLATLGGVESEGLVLDAFTARPTDDDSATELALLTTRDRLHLLVVSTAESGPARAWANLDAARHYWPSVDLLWDEVRSFESARRDIPVQWQVRSPWPPLAGGFEAVSSHMQSMPTAGAIHPVLGAYEVAGRVVVGGAELEVTGVVRHFQR